MKRELTLDAGQDTLVTIVAECDMTRVRLLARGDLWAVVVVSVLIVGYEQLQQADTPMPLTMFQPQSDPAPFGMPMAEGSRMVVRLRNDGKQRKTLSIELEAVQ